MAEKADAAGQAFGPVLAAVATMQGNVPRSEKSHAHDFLEKFQKSVRSPLAPHPDMNLRTSRNMSY
jgi:transportin-3